jgi:hypothetical protein
MSRRHPPPWRCGPSPAVDHFFARAAFLAEIGNAAAVLGRTADLAANIERLADG